MAVLVSRSRASSGGAKKKPLRFGTGGVNSLVKRFSPSRRRLRNDDHGGSADGSNNEGVAVKGHDRAGTKSPFSVPVKFMGRGAGQHQLRSFYPAIIR